MGITITGTKTLYVGQTEYLRPVVTDNTVSPAIPATNAKVGATVTTQPGRNAPEAPATTCYPPITKCFELHLPVGAVDPVTAEALLKVTGHYPTDDWDYYPPTPHPPGYDANPANFPAPGWYFATPLPGTVQLEELDSAGAAYNPRRLVNCIVDVQPTFLYLSRSNDGATGTITVHRGYDVVCTIKARTATNVAIPGVWVGMVDRDLAPNVTMSMANGVNTYTDAFGEATVTVHVAANTTPGQYNLRAKLPSFVQGCNCNQFGSSDPTASSYYDGKSAVLNLNVVV